MGVTIVILNWNGRDFLAQFLSSVLATDYPNFHVLVADNASTDDSVAFLRETYPQVEVVVFDENHGFAEGNNRALPFVRTPYLVLLNSDVEVPPGWLAPLVAAAEADAELIGLQPKIRHWHRKTHFEYAGACGGFVDTLGYPFARGRVLNHLEEDRGQYDTPTDVFWATGCCLFLRKAYVEEVGLFDRRFFAHMEEIDFAWRAHRFGYRLRCEPAAVVYHVGGGTLPKTSPRKAFLNFRNSLLMLWNNAPEAQRKGLIFRRMLLDGLAAGVYFVTGRWKFVRAVWDAHQDFRRLRKQPTNVPLAAPRPTLKSLPGVMNGSLLWRATVLGRKTFARLWPGFPPQAPESP